MVRLPISPGAMSLFTISRILTSSTLSSVISQGRRESYNRYTNVNMTATREGKLRKDHYKSTYSQNFNEECEELRRELSPLPSMTGGKSTSLGFNYPKHRRGKSDVNVVKDTKKDKMWKLIRGGALHVEKNRRLKAYNVTMNNEGVPLRNLTLGGMLGQSPIEKSRLND